MGRCWLGSNSQHGGNTAVCVQGKNGFFVRPAVWGHDADSSSLDLGHGWNKGDLHLDSW
jgi:hypothetical protein